VTRPALPPDILVRAAEEADAPALASFRCSTGPEFEQEVEAFVRDHALPRALDGDCRLLLVLERDRMIACVGHRPESLITRRGEMVYPRPFTRLHLLALALDQQGRRLDDGRRLSDLVMATLIFDALDTRGEQALTAIVARDNLRSIALCERHGLRSQVRYDSRHIRLSGHFTIRR
jgi:ribosomal protein S18 acetylase RimI-like enzyme